MRKKILIGLGVVVIIIIILMATGVLKFNIGIAPSSPITIEDENTTIVKEFIVPEGWEKYTSGEYGYSVAYPNNWNLKENNSEGTREVLMFAPENKAFVNISAFKDSTLSSPETVEASIAEYKASLEAKDEDQEILKDFRSEMMGEVGGFNATGIMAVNGVAFQFLEQGLFATNGRVLIMRGAINTSKIDLTQEEFDSFVATVKQIMDSFKI
ncbi:MAG: PsbP-related protein [Candidatus Nealsonbacteria bacterium]